MENEDDVAVVDRFLAGRGAPTVPADSSPSGFDPLTTELVATHVRLGTVLLAQGQRDAALAELRRALALDPESFIVRKQIWAIEHPERFGPTIDFGWQKEQLAAERAAEAAACGPAGCQIEGT